MLKRTTVSKYVFSAAMILFVCSAWCDDVKIKKPAGLDGQIAPQIERGHEYLHNFTGKIGDSAIGATLYSDDFTFCSLTGKTFRATFFFAGELKDYEMIGSFKNDSAIELVQHGKTGEVLSRFDGTVYWCAKIVGVWNGGAMRDRPFTLYADNMTVGFKGAGRYAPECQNDSSLESNIRKFQKAVLSGDKELVASLTSFPVNCANRKIGKTARIKNKADFIRLYDKVFTKKYIEAIRSCVPHNLFHNSRGVRLGQTGTAWFDYSGKAIAF